MYNVILYRYVVISLLLSFFAICVQSYSLLGLLHRNVTLLFTLHYHLLLYIIYKLYIIYFNIFIIIIRHIIDIYYDQISTNPSIALHHVMCFNLI